jgi:hypothetical protein
MGSLTGNDLIRMFCNAFPLWKPYIDDLMIGYDWANNRTRMYYTDQIVGSNNMVTGDEAEMFKTPAEAMKTDEI